MSAMQQRDLTAQLAPYKSGHREIDARFVMPGAQIRHVKMEGVQRLKALISGGMGYLQVIALA